MQYQYGDFGTRLRHVRIEMGLNMAEMAMLLDHSYKTQYNYENNRRDPGTARAAQIAKKLNVPPEWMCGIGETFEWQK